MTEEKSYCMNVGLYQVYLFNVFIDMTWTQSPSSWKPLSPKWFLFLILLNSHLNIKVCYCKERKETVNGDQDSKMEKSN